jgi:hypothetical protein
VYITMSFDPENATRKRTEAKLCDAEGKLLPEIQKVAAQMLRDWKYRRQPIVLGRRVCQRDHFGLFIYGTWGVSCDVMMREGDPPSLAERDIRYEIMMAWVRALNAVLPTERHVTHADIYITINRHLAAHDERHPDPVETADEYAKRQLRIDRVLPRNAEHYRMDAWSHEWRKTGRRTVTAGDADIPEKAASYREHAYKPGDRVRWAHENGTFPDRPEDGGGLDLQWTSGARGAINGEGTLRGRTASGWIVELSPADAKWHPDCLDGSTMCVMPLTHFRPRGPVYRG